jgi:acetyl-CoA C-acetyltransferase
MNELPPNTPIIIGIGFCQVKSDNPHDCPEAIELMFNAINDAASDAGNADIVQQLDSISVQKGSWQYSNPGKLLADKLGCPPAKSILADLGVLQIMTFFDLCQNIKEGKQEIGVITGGESRYRDLRSMIIGEPVETTVQDDTTPAPDVYHTIPDAFSSELEDKRGVWAPVEFYAIAESALRYRQGLSIEEHQNKIAELYSGFSAIAAKNPHAWLTDILSPEDILTPSAKNAMIAFPYTKRMISQWNVNQSVAVIVCSYAKAKALGLNNKNWIYPIAATQSRNVVNLAQKPKLHSHPGTILTGKRALELARITTDDIDIAELYSCFPSAIQACAKDLELEGKCPINISGSMAYAGGPFNHGAVDSLARMVEVLREHKNTHTEKCIGMVTSLSGMFGKQGCGLLATEADSNGFQFDDITDIVAQQEKPIAIDANYTGDATIVAYSVMYNKGDISHAIAYCDTPNGKRTVVRTNNIDIAEIMTHEEFVGRTIHILTDGEFTLTTNIIHEA